MAFADLMDAALGTCMATLGESVTYTPQGGSPMAVQGIFNDKVYEIDPGLGTRILSKLCLLEIQLSAFGDVTPQQLDTAVVRSITYKVIEVDRDGSGAATLHLQKS